MGPKCEELNLSKSSPPCLTERTSMGCAATSLMGPHPDSCSAASLGQIVDAVSSFGVMERSGWVAAYGGKGTYPGPKPVHVYRVQSR